MAKSTALKLSPPPTFQEKVTSGLERARVILSIIESVAKHLAGAVAEIKTTLSPGE